MWHCKETKTPAESCTNYNSEYHTFLREQTLRSASRCIHWSVSIAWWSQTSSEMSLRGQWAAQRRIVRTISGGSVNFYREIKVEGVLHVISDHQTAQLKWWHLNSKPTIVTWACKGNSIPPDSLNAPRKGLMILCCPDQTNSWKWKNKRKKT